MGIMVASRLVAASSTITVTLHRGGNPFESCVLQALPGLARRIHQKSAYYAYASQLVQRMYDIGQAI